MCNLYSMTTTTEAIQQLVAEWATSRRFMPSNRKHPAIQRNAIAKRPLLVIDCAPLRSSRISRPAKFDWTKR